jgi:hypothetical protein
VSASGNGCIGLSIEAYCGVIRQIVAASQVHDPFPQPMPQPYMLHEKSRISGFAVPENTYAGRSGNRVR